MGNGGGHGKNLWGRVGVPPRDGGGGADFNATHNIADVAPEVAKLTRDTESFASGLDHEVQGREILATSTACNIRHNQHAARRRRESTRPDPPRNAGLHKPTMANPARAARTHQDILA